MQTIAANISSHQRLSAPLRSALALLLIMAGMLACNVTFSTTVSTPVVTVRPAVLFLAPDPNSAIVEGAPVQIAVSAHDELRAGVARIDFSIDGVAIGSQVAPKPTGQTDFTALQIWTAQGIQGHLIDAIAYRADNSVVGDTAITITVSQLILSPSVSPSPLPSLTPTDLPTFTPSVTIVTIAAFNASSSGTATPFGTPPPSLPPITLVPPTINGPSLTVLAPILNVRGGPSTAYAIIGTIPANAVVAIVGRNSDRSWFVVQNGPLRGWVINSPSFMTVVGDLSALPLVAAPPSPVPVNVSPTALPVLAWTSTPV